MNKKLRSLTWKYFWQQKLEEISLGIIYSSYSILFLSIISMIARSFDSRIMSKYGENIICNSENIGCFIIYMLLGILYLFCIILIIALVFFILDSIFGRRIRKKWKKAKKRAKKDIKQTGGKSNG